MDTNYPSNSRTQKSPDVAPDKNIEPLEGLHVEVKNAGFFKRLKSSFIMGDARSVGKQVLWEVLVPTAKDAAMNSVTTFSQMLFYGRATGGPMIGRGVPQITQPANTTVNYSGMSSLGNRLMSAGAQQIQPNAGTNGYAMSDVIVGSQPEAEAILGQMVGIIAEYKACSVADMYRIIGHSPNPQDDRYGWSDLSAADTRRIGGALHLIFPEPKVLR